jgi:REP element-mobilizing transposase RayT
MPVRLFVLVTWTTYRRMPMIAVTEAAFLRRFLPAEAQRHGGLVVALGMVQDIVHLVLRLPATFSLPRLVQGLKGASARLVNRDVALSRTGLRWATGYDARSVGIQQLSDVIAYVKQQAKRHPDLRIVDRVSLQGASRECRAGP